ncbi:MAG: ABC transporter transmembrane domain-containing protein [Alphaproteobacteria bacterium]
MNNANTSPNNGANTSHFQRLLGLMQPYAGRLAVGIAAVLLTTACMLILPQYLKQIFDAALQQRDVTALNMVLLYVAATVVILVVGVMLRTYFLQYTASRIINDLRGHLFARVVGLDVVFFELRAAGEIISRLLSDVTVIREFIQFAAPQLIRGILLALGSLAALFYTNVQLTLVLCVAGIPIVLMAGYLGKTWRRYSASIQDNFAKLSAVVEQAVGGIRTVKAFAQEEAEAARYNVFRANALVLAQKLILSSGAFTAFNVVLGFSAICGVIWLGGRDVIAGTMTMGDMMAYLLYLAFLGDGASNLASFWPALQSALGATERVFELLNERPQLQAPVTSHLLPVAKKGRAVALKNVTFHYPSRPDAAALAELNLSVNAGETVAIVGPSGAGKSTLFGLLLRFYDPQEGHILVDGVDVKNLSFTELRGTMAMVAQEATMFSATIRENIAYGKPEATEDEVVAAAKAAYAWEFIAALPEGLNTLVGERGVRLSGGQKQRLAIARAVLRNPAILLLDEATSHLDAESERAVQAALESLRQGRTTLVVAHRLSTVKSADRIVVLNKGRVEAVGTHAELLATCALYKHLAQLQFVDA